MIKFMDLLILILRCCYFGGARLSARSMLRRVVAIDRDCRNVDSKLLSNQLNAY